MTASLERVQKMDARMQELEKDRDYLNEVFENLKKIHNRKTELEAYYGNNWSDDLDENPDAQYGILSEDGLWNLLYEIESTEKEILKFIAHTL